MNKGTQECLKFCITVAQKTANGQKISGPSLITMILLYDRSQALCNYKSCSNLHFPRITCNSLVFPRPGQAREEPMIPVTPFYGKPFLDCVTIKPYRSKITTEIIEHSGKT